MKIVYLLIIQLFCCSLFCFAQSPTDITVMTYNILNFPNPNNSNSLGNDAARATYFRQIVESENADVILLQEFKSYAGVSILLNELNNNGTLGKTYAAANNYTGYGSSGQELGNMLIYNDDVLNLTAEQELPIVSTGTAQDGTVQTSPRGATNYSLAVVSPDCDIATTAIEFYSTHLKGSNDGADNNDLSDRDRRLLGVNDLLSQINTLASNTNVVIGGDFNVYADNVNGGTYSEPAYVALLNNLNHPFIDVINGWVRNTQSNVTKYTQSTRTSSNQFGNGGVPGGLDDRFDLIFINQTINSGSSNVSYNANSYSVVSSANVLNGNALDGNQALENAVYRMSDHYAVKMDLHITFDQLTACMDCNGNPAVINSLPSLTVDATPISLSATPTGGSFSGNGVIFNAFNPVLAGPGLHTINYSFTDIDGCVYESSQNILVGSIIYNFVNYNLGVISP